MTTVRYPDLNPTLFGVKGDGTDVTSAFEAMLAAWVDADDNPGDLVLPPGDYYLPAGVTFIPTSNLVGGRIVGYGARIHTDADYALTFDCAAGSKLWRNLTIEGLHLRGGLRLRGAGGSNTIHRWTVRNLDVEQFDAHGLYVDGAFEGVVDGGHFHAADANTTGDCIHLTDGPGNVSSIDLYGVTTRGGSRGLNDNGAGDTDVFGGTFLEAQQEGVRLYNAVGSTVTGAHIESCWQASPVSAKEGAAIRAIGRATIVGLRAVASGANMRYGVSATPGAGSVIVQGGLGSGLTSFVYADGASGQVVTIGVEGGINQANFTGTVSSIG